MTRRMQLTISMWLAAVFGCLLPEHAAWVSRPALTTTRTPQAAKWSAHRQARPPKSSRLLLVMRDRSSSYWFQVGDSVKVVSSDVEKSGVNLQHRVGKVAETWEKCDVDPTCCCAEQVDTDMAVRVEFRGSLYDESVKGTSFDHYFAEDELEKCMVGEEEAPETAATAVPFDGMSCVAFKLDHLKMGERAQRLAAFEKSKQSGDA